MKLKVTPNETAINRASLTDLDIITLVSVTVFLEQGFLESAGDCYAFLVASLEDEAKEPWFVDHSIENDVAKVLLYRKWAHVLNNPPVLVIEELAA
jgi:hypothetical protein